MDESQTGTKGTNEPQSRIRVKALAFIVFNKAFDSIYPNVITKSLTGQGVDEGYVETLLNIYKAAKARLTIPNY